MRPSAPGDLFLLERRSASEASARVDGPSHEACSDSLKRALTQEADDAVNAQDAVSIGSEALKEHERQWPEGFRNTISRKVKTIADGKKFVSVGTEKVYDTTVIYSRVIGIQASSRELDLKKVLRHELAPVPTSMFHDSGAARMCKAKSYLKKRLAREISSRIV